MHKFLFTQNNFVFRTCVWIIIHKYFIILNFFLCAFKLMIKGIVYVQCLRSVIKLSFERKAFGQHFLCHKKKLFYIKRNFIQRESFFRYYILWIIIQTHIRNTDSYSDTDSEKRDISLSNQWFSIIIIEVSQRVAKNQIIVEKTSPQKFSILLIIRGVSLT